MLANRAGHLEDRRRRVLTEEVIGPAAPAAEDAPRRRAKGDRPALKSRRVTDLVPRSWWALAGWLALLLGAIVGLEALYYFMPRLAAESTDGRIASFDLDDEGSLAMWFSSTLLLLAAAMTLIVFGVRKQQPDDYHARYRVWLWGAVCWLVMSLDESASLHEAFKELMSRQTGQRLYGDGSMWWVIGYGVVLGAVGLRLLLDMLVSRLSSAVFVAAGVCFAVAVAVQIEWLLPASGARGVMLEEGLEMLGDVLLLLSMTLHARFLIGVAEGNITPRERKKRRREKESRRPRGDDAPASERATSERQARGRGFWGWLRRDKGDDAAPRRSKEKRADKAAGDVAKSATGGARPSGSAPSATIRAGTTTRVDPAQEGPPLRHKMSKAERKAMRRSQRGDRYGEDDEDDDG